MAFTTLVLAQLFNAFNARSDVRSAFAHLFTNRWLWLSIALSVVLQCVVLYLPAMQRAFGTVPLGPMDWARCLVAASAVFWIREGTKLMAFTKFSESR
jgi:Ca2+-transporting ATPase